VTRLEKLLLAAGGLGTFVTGLVFAWMKYFLTTDDPYAVIHHPWQPAVLKLHILFAPVLVFAVGLVFTQHVWRQWRSGRPAGKRSGLGTMLTVGPMVFSGYLIQVVPGGGVLSWVIGVHLVTGTTYFLTYAGHRAMMRLRDRRRRVAATDRRREARVVREEDVA
jgi:hypothetical protein